jgi:geranylgeranyl reductase family protein
MDSEKKYDIIVAGAGIAGCLAAAMAAKKGAEVLLLDRNPPENVGKKNNWGWTCGDAVAGSHLDFIKEKSGISFSRPELDLKVDGVYAFSPDLKSKYAFDGVGYVLDRPVFERKLLEIAKKNGAEYISEFEVEGPIVENGSVVGIFGKDKEKKPRNIKAKVVIDALGVATVLRRRLPDNDFVEKNISIDDIESTGRYIYEFDPDHEDINYYDPKNAIIHLNQELAPGGYGWVFPKSDNKINIGLGVQKRSLEIRNKKLGRNDTLQMLIENYIKWNPVLKNLRLFNKDNNGKGIWSVAVRRQVESLVFNGYMGAGDSMAMPNPISAGGIGPAMVAGILAGESAAEAVQAGDTSISGLWKYNLEFNEAYGKKTAGLEVLRIYLQSLNNDTLNYGFRTFLTAKEASDLTLGLIPELSLASKLKMVLKGASNINAFSNLVFAVGRMKKLNQTYSNFPEDPAKFAKWRDKVRSEMEEVKQKFIPNPI